MPPCRLPLVVRPQPNQGRDQDAPLFRLVTPGGEPLGTIQLERHERALRSVTRALQACARSRIPPHRIETGAHARRVSQVARGDSYPPNGCLDAATEKAGPRLASSGLRHPPSALNAAPLAPQYPRGRRLASTLPEFPPEPPAHWRALAALQVLGELCLDFSLGLGLGGVSHAHDLHSWPVPVGPVEATKDLAAHEAGAFGVERDVLPLRVLCEPDLVWGGQSGLARSIPSRLRADGVKEPLLTTSTTTPPAARQREAASRVPVESVRGRGWNRSSALRVRRPPR